ncbi:MAG: porin [Flavobacteriales bacterium]
MNCTKHSFIILLLCALSHISNSQIDAPIAPRDTTAKSKNKQPKVKIEGVITMHYLREFNTNGDSLLDADGFRLFKARLQASGKINKKIGYTLMIDPRTPEPGGLLRDAYIQLWHIKNQEIRIGRQKTQFGWENRTSSTQRYTVMLGTMSDGITRGFTLRDNGIGIIGHIPINKHWRIEDAITFTNGARMDITGPYDFNTKKALWGRIGVRYKKDELTFRAGGSFGTGGIRDIGDNIIDAADDIYIDIARVGADLQIEHKSFFMAAEWAMQKDTHMDTLYLESMGYQVVLALKTKWKIGPLMRYDTDEDEDSKVWTVGAYYGNLKDKYRILVNYVFRGNIKDVPEGHDDRLYIQMQVAF